MSASRGNHYERNRTVRAIHVMARSLGLDADARHDLQEQVTGKRSLTDMDDTELQAVRASLRGRENRSGDRDRLPNTPSTAKLRALWISGWHLGVVHDRSDRALAAFVRRTLGIESASWSFRGGGKVVEALKLWLARPVGNGGGGVQWTEDGSGRPSQRPEVARGDVLRAQWRRMWDLGLARTPHAGALEEYVARLLKVGARSVETLTAAQADVAIRHFGERIRKAAEDAA